MQSPRPRPSLSALAGFVILLFGLLAARADDFPAYLPPNYKPLFKHFVDQRTLPERMLNLTGLTSKEYGRGFALVAGVSKYPYIAGPDGNLEPAAEDIRKLVNYLRYYEKFDEIVVLADANMTQQNLSFFLEKYFPRRLREFPKSRFLFAYSGHGTLQNERGYLLTSQARDLNDIYNGVSLTTLRAIFEQVIDSGFHVLALINACYGGEFVKRPFGERPLIPKYPGAHAISAGGTKERTWHDGSVGTGSIFFEKLYGALDGRAGGAVVNVYDLIAYLRREVQISTDQRQNPVPGDLSKEPSLGSFFFFNRRPLVEERFLPAWDASEGVPFGVVLPTGPSANQGQPPIPPVLPLPPASSRTTMIVPPGLSEKSCFDRIVGAVARTFESQRAAQPLSRSEECDLNPKDSFKECDVCPEMVVVPAGNFAMGADGGESDENPPHRVTIAKAFAVGKFSVTRGEFAVFVNETGHQTEGGCHAAIVSGWMLPQDRSWRSPGFEQDDRHPVVCVNWDDADAFAVWLSQKTGQPYRLLTESEREYAARAGKTTRYSFGENPDEICRYGNGADLTVKQRFSNLPVANCSDGYVFTSPVGSFKPNDWGLYDMHGNVRDRVEDCYHPNYNGAPTDGSAWIKGGDCSRRVLRGGSWVNAPKDLRAASRDAGAPGALRYDNYGFRVARNLIR